MKYATAAPLTAAWAATDVCMGPITARVKVLPNPSERSDAVTVRRDDECCYQVVDHRRR